MGSFLSSSITVQLTDDVNVWDVIIEDDSSVSDLIAAASAQHKSLKQTDWEFVDTNISSLQSKPTAYIIRFLEDASDER